MIKTSATFWLMSLFTAYMLGAYVTLFVSQDWGEKPAFISDFDVNAFSGPWYNLLMSNDLPFFIDECA